MLETREYKAEVLQLEIRVIEVVTDSGINITVAGGELPHIGAVCVADESGDILSLITLPGHRETEIVKTWANKIAQKTCQCTVVSAGIHYDHLSKEGIRQVLTACEELLERVS